MVAAGLDVPRLSPWLDKANTVAGPGFDRWLVPPCALAIHLCIGMAYGFSVFWLPLSRALGVSDPIVCEGMTLAQALATTRSDWRVSDRGPAGARVPAQPTHPSGAPAVPHACAGRPPLPLEPVGTAAARGSAAEVAVEGFGGITLLAWSAVCIPIAWGIYQTLAKAAVLLK